METEARLTKLASCAGCGAKVGAGTLATLLQDFKTRTDPRLIVGFDAANAISDIYAMGGEPHLALNLLCVTEQMEEEWIREILRGGYDKAYEAGVIISGGHTIHGSEPLYGLAVTGFAKPEQIRKNDAAKPGDMLILTKPLGIGILTTAAKAGFADPALTDRITRQMATLNKAACEAMQGFRVHGCTDVTGFGLMGHSCEMAQGSGCTLHLQTGKIPYHPEALEMADMGLIPAGAYRNRDFAEHAAEVRGEVPRAVQDILYDPQTSGGLLIAVDERDGEALLRTMKSAVPGAAAIGYVTEAEEKAIIIEE